MFSPIFNVHDIIILLTAGGSLAVALLIFFKRKPSNVAATFLAIFFLCVCGNAISSLLMWHYELKKLSSEFPIFSISLLLMVNFLEGPALYSYVASTCQHATKRRASSYLWHFFIPILAIIFIVAIGFRVEHFQRHFFESSAATNFIEVMMALHPWFYALLCLTFIKTIKSSLREFYSDFTQTEAKWLSLVIYGCVFLWGWRLLTRLLNAYFSSLPDTSIATLLGLSNSYFGFGLFLAMYYFWISHTMLDVSKASEISASGQPEINVASTVSLDISTRPLNTDIDPTPTPSKQSENLTALEVEIENRALAMRIQKIKAIVATKTPFLESNINIERFAESIDEKPRDVSYVIKTHFNSNFFDFINGFRIEEAKAVLSWEKEISMAEVMALSGFSSKSSFYRVFKQKTGITPVKFREIQLKKLKLEKAEI
jgi:AraC-like DNA-binding protein